MRGLAQIPLVASIAAVPAAAQEQVTAFVNVSVIPMDRERVLADQTVVVRGDRIVEIGPVSRVTVPSQAVQIDGRGKFLIPGLADMHVHLAEPDRLTADRLFLYLANGVTTIREMMSGPDHVQLKGKVSKGLLLGPRIYTAFNPGDWPSGEISSIIATIKSEGYDFVKFYGSLDEPAKFDTIVAEARRAGLPVVGHVDPQPGVILALRAGLASIEHLWGYTKALGLDFAVAPDEQPPIDMEKLRQIAAATRQAGVWNTPTMQVMEWLMPTTGVPTEGSQRVRRWLEWHQAIVKALADQGAGLLLGADTPNLLQNPMLAGFSIHHELELLVGAGLSPYQALETGTRNPAVFLGTLDSTGTVAVGKRADLVLLDGNPLRDVRHTAWPAGVMVGGRWFDRTAIDNRLDGILPGVVAAAPSEVEGSGITMGGSSDDAALKEKLEQMRRTSKQALTKP